MVGCWCRCPRECCRGDKWASPSRRPERPGTRKSRSRPSTPGWLRRVEDGWPADYMETPSAFQDGPRSVKLRVTRRRATCKEEEREEWHNECGILRRRRSRNPRRERLDAKRRAPTSNDSKRPAAKRRARFVNRGKTWHVRNATSKERLFG